MDQDKFVALIQFENFCFEYEETAKLFEEDFKVVATIDRNRLIKAWCVWIKTYHQIRKADKSAFNRMIHLVGTLIEAASTQNIIEYRLVSANEGVVSDKFRRVLVQYPNQITALSVGSNIYSLAIQRHSQQEASCQLTAMELEVASRRIIQNPKAAYKFREILKLKSIKSNIGATDVFNTSRN